MTRKIRIALYAVAASLLTFGSAEVALAYWSSPTPNMNLTLSQPGQTVGPTWAQNLNTQLYTIDGHNHSSGRGALVPVAGLNLNAAMNLAMTGTSYPLASPLAVEFNNGSVLTSAAPYVSTLFVSGGELYYNDAVGNQIKLTLNGVINIGSTGQISGMTGTASVAYSATGSGSYTFNGNAANTPATLAVGGVKLTDTGGTPHSVSIIPNASSDTYTMALPPHLAAQTVGSQVPMLIDPATGVMVNGLIKAAQINASAGIVTGQIAQNTLTGGATGNLALATVTGDSGGNGTGNLVAHTITGNNIVNAAITTTQIATSTILGSNIHPATIDSTRIIAPTSFPLTAGSNWSAAHAWCYTDVSGTTHLSGYMESLAGYSLGSIFSIPITCMAASSTVLDHSWIPATSNAATLLFLSLAAGQNTFTAALVSNSAALPNNGRIYVDGVSILLGL